MKKLLALMLAAALALSLVACGGGSGAGDTNTPSTGNGDTTSTDTPSMTKEEMIAQAKECTGTDISNATVENMVRAKEEYCGKTLLIRGEILEISSDHITLGVGGVTNIEVYLQEEDISNLEKEQIITIVGNTGKEITEGTFAPGIPQKVYTYEVRQAYLVSDIAEWTCTILEADIDYFNKNQEIRCKVKLGNSSTHYVYFQNADDYPGADIEITVSGKEIDGNLFDAVIVK